MYVKGRLSLSTSFRIFSFHISPSIGQGSGIASSVLSSYAPPNVKSPVTKEMTGFLCLMFVVSVPDEKSAALLAL
jgi:hypothetical protein